MKSLNKIMRYILLSLSCLFFSNCVTTYDYYGKPVQTVDPVVATVGAVAIGAIAYSAGQNSRYSNGYCTSSYNYSHRYYSNYRHHGNYRRYSYGCYKR